MIKQEVETIATAAPVSAPKAAIGKPDPDDSFKG